LRQSVIIGAKRMAYPRALFLWIVRKQTHLFPDGRVSGFFAAVKSRQETVNADSGLESETLRG